MSDICKSEKQMKELVSLAVKQQKEMDDLIARQREELKKCLLTAVMDVCIQTSLARQEGGQMW